MLFCAEEPSLIGMVWMVGEPTPVPPSAEAIGVVRPMVQVEVQGVVEKVRPWPWVIAVTVPVPRLLR